MKTQLETMPGPSDSDIEDYETRREQIRECSECGKSKKEYKFVYAVDRYTNSIYKKVCEACVEKVESRLWFDRIARLDRGW